MLIGDNMDNVNKRIDELITILESANYSYYVLDNPTITDQEYDKYLRELQDIEEEYTNLKRNNSPTERVGGVAINEFSKVKHKIAMLSLSDVFSEGELIEFDQRIKNEG